MIRAVVLFAIFATVVQGEFYLAPILSLLPEIGFASCHLKLDYDFAPNRPRYPVEVLPQAAEEVCCGKNLIFFKVEQVLDGDTSS